MADDTVIIEQCRNGDLGQLEVLVNRYGSRLYGLCLKLSRDPADADDLFQDTWVRVMDHINRFEPGKRFLPWLFTICLNRYRDRYRKKKRWSLKVAGNPVLPDGRDGVEIARDHRPLADEQLMESDRLKRLQHCLNRLDDSLRIPVLLYYYRSFTLEEIGEMMDIPEGTVKSRLSRARNLLKELMED